jgi:hypothetical protein
MRLADFSFFDLTETEAVDGATLRFKGFRGAEEERSGLEIWVWVISKSTMVGDGEDLDEGWSLLMVDVSLIAGCSVMQTS